MSLKTTLIGLTFILCNISKAQIDRASFEKAVDYVNCKTVECSLKDNQGDLEAYRKNCPCGTTDGAKVRSFLASIGRYSATIALSDEISHLKGAFKNNWMPQDAAHFLSESIFMDKTKYQKLFVFADKRKTDPTFVSFKEKLYNELLSQFTASGEAGHYAAASNDQNQLRTLEGRIAALEIKPSPQGEKGGWFDGFVMQIDILSILIAVFVSWMVFQIIRNKKEIPGYIKEYVKQKIDEAPLLGKDHANHRVNTIEAQQLKDEIEKLKTEIGALQLKMERAKVPLEIVAPADERELKRDAKSPETKVETFFLSTPNSDGSFNESSASPQYREGASIYRFTRIGNNRAKFQIDEREASIRLALQYPDKNIDPVCEAENAFNPKAKRIATIDMGDVELIGDRWVKNTKAKIRYED